MADSIVLKKIQTLAETLHDPKEGFHGKRDGVYLVLMIFRVERF